MDISTHTQYILRICQQLLTVLGDTRHVFIRKDGQTLINGEACSYSFSITFIREKLLVLDEQIIPERGQTLVHRHWIFEHSDGDSWQLELAQKDGHSLTEEVRDIELKNLTERIDAVRQGRSGAFEMPVAGGQSLDRGSVSRVMERHSFRVFTLAAAGLVLAGLTFTISVSSLQYGRMLKTVQTLSESIRRSSEDENAVIKQLGGELDQLSGQVADLKRNVEREKDAFEFNRQQTAMNVRSLADGFPWRENSRKRAYLYLADRIEEADSYGEVMYQISRLPENNDQAETLMATDKDNRYSLTHYEPVFLGLALPVRIPEGTGDKGNFMISSGYTERRLSPLGAGGVRPHLAVDIINLDNITRISKENHILRDESRRGIVQSVWDGKIIDVGYNGVYGWYTEVRHEMTPDAGNLYPNARFWTSYYAHLNEETEQPVGTDVKRGEALGRIGNTGISTGPHVHFELRVYRPGGAYEGPYGNYDKINPYIKTGF